MANVREALYQCIPQELTLKDDTKRIKLFEAKTDNFNVELFVSYTQNSNNESFWVSLLGEGKYRILDTQGVSMNISFYYDKPSKSWYFGITNQASGLLIRKKLNYGIFVTLLSTAETTEIPTNNTTFIVKSNSDLVYLSDENVAVDTTNGNTEPAITIKRDTLMNKSVTCKNGLTVSSGATTLQAATTNELLTCKNGLTVSSGATTLQAATTNELLTCKNGLTVSSGATTLQVATTKGTLTCENGLTVSSGATTLQVATTKGTLTCENGLMANSMSYFSGVLTTSLKCTTTLDVSGATTLQAATTKGTLTCENGLTVSSGITSVQNVTLNGKLTGSGSIVIDNTIEGKSFNASSDKRLKENIVPYTTKKSILDLPVYKYNFISDNNKIIHVGCLAQDLQEIAPELVHEKSNGYLSVEDGKVVYVLIAEVAKLKQEIDSLKAELAELKK